MLIGPSLRHELRDGISFLLEGVSRLVDPQPVLAARQFLVILCSGLSRTLEKRRRTGAQLQPLKEQRHPGGGTWHEQTDTLRCGFLPSGRRRFARDGFGERAFRHTEGFQRVRAVKRVNRRDADVTGWTEGPAALAARACATRPQSLRAGRQIRYRAWRGGHGQRQPGRRCASGRRSSPRERRAD